MTLKDKDKLLRYQGFIKARYNKPQSERHKETKDAHLRTLDLRIPFAVQWSTKIKFLDEIKHVSHSCHMVSENGYSNSSNQRMMK